MIYPRHLTSQYPSPTGKPMWTPETAWPGSWVLIGAMAAVTQRIRFTNAVYIAPAVGDNRRNRLRCPPRP
jgi:hypothetical protein